MAEPSMAEVTHAWATTDVMFGSRPGQSVDFDRQIENIFRFDCFSGSRKLDGRVLRSMRRKYLLYWNGYVYYTLRCSTSERFKSRSFRGFRTAQQYLYLLQRGVTLAVHDSSMVSEMLVFGVLL